MEINWKHMKNLANKAGIFLLAIFCGIAINTKVQAQSDHSKKPNIIIILFDDLGYGDLGIYGNPTIQTPNMDRMAMEGMKFTQFYTAATVCTPSRAGLLTGRLPVRTGMNNGVLFPKSKKGLPLQFPTIAEELKLADYSTACIGKWHLGNHSPYLPTDRGFDYFYGLPYSNDMSPLALIKNKKIIEQPVNQNTLTQRYTKQAIKFIERNKNQPFFLYLAHTFPHRPLHTSKAFQDTSARGLYGDVVQELDWSVGQVLEELRNTGLAKNTLVFVTSDNGPWFQVAGKNGGSAGLLRGGKGSTWEGGMRVPAIAWWPGTIKGGVVTQALATTMDLFSTSLALANVKPPSNGIIDGVNLMPLLTGEKQKVRDYVWFYFYRSNRLSAVRYDQWKLEFYTQPGYRYKKLENIGTKLIYVPIENQPNKHDPPLLFNINVDPSEKYNVAEKHPKVIKQIEEKVKIFKKNMHHYPDQIAPKADHVTLLEKQ